MRTEATILMELVIEVVWFPNDFFETWTGHLHVAPVGLLEYFDK
jgi:hypothetical protein